MKPIVVIKLGGSSLVNPDTLQELIQLVKGYQKRRHNVVLVHGGGPAINQELTDRNITWKFIDGQRQTTPEMMDVIETVLAKNINGMLVESLRAGGIQAAALSGAKHHILHCTQSSAELMQVGQVNSVDTSSIEAVIKTFRSCVPVIAPIGVGAGGERYNVNADWAATKIAIALQASKLIFLTDQTGILDQDKQLVRKANPVMIEKMIETGAISGGMCTKVRAMMVALSHGTKQVRVLHASSASQLFSEEQLGTLLTEKKGALHGRAS